jgi:hypothetical protein
MVSAFNLLDPRALVLAGFDGPKEITIRDKRSGGITSYGGNRGCWPVAIGHTKSRKDTVTPRLDQSPFEELGVTLLLRLWTPSEAHVKRLSVFAVGIIQDHLSTAYLRDYVDIGPDADLSVIAASLQREAARLGVLTWSEGHIETFCANVAARRGRDGVEIHHVENELRRWENVGDLDLAAGVAGHG